MHSPTRGAVVLTLLLLSPALVSAQEDEKWDVERSLGTATPLSFETTEGTWMNVDVSPDGQTILFDLLGDIYSMPIEGGVATRIVGGLAFDMQPRFSPDGSSVAFISDRDGNFNIWLMDPDGSDPRQVSKEASREVNSPAWSPDGQYVFARKHFVERRSLGAGEVWMYHVSGGAGLQVVGRNGWQKDLGEPVISPDGKYLYYSRNVWPGQTFEYNKNPNRTIYAVRRVELATGEESTVTSRPGGSITPRLSPDGSKLAFIRRVRLKSVLFLRELATGEEWPLWDGLERDMQEAWAIHGVYAQYDWTPDGNSIVIWAQGKLWSVDVATGEATLIPFTAQVDQQVHTAVRFEPEVAPSSFDVRMIRDVTTSPDGRFIVYSALGRLYIKEMPESTPRRLTRDDRIEFSPAFSPDGQWIAYGAWTDAGKGRIRIIRTDGSGGRDLIDEPGHYTEPSFSPDGRRVVYRSTRGDLTRGPTYGENPGIFVVAADGSGEPVLIRKSGTEPRFDHTGERIFVSQSGAEGLQLVSVDLDGTDEVTHFQTKNATQIVPSPDGEWVAFTERFRAYVAAFPRSGQTVDLGPKTSAFPVAAISDNAGANLHWSSDSRAVHWSLGPEYFSRDLTETFSFVQGAGTEPAEPEAEGLEIGFEHPFDVPSGSVALVGARVITLADGAQDGGVIENAAVIVEGNRITSVGPSRDVKIPVGVLTVDASGKTIMPGIVDVHAHVGGESNGILAELSWRLAANVAFGVTTSHDPSNDTETVFTNSEMIKAGLKLGPRLFSTGTILYGAESSNKAIVNSYDDAYKHLSRMKAVGAFSVKSYNQRRRDARQMIIKAARELEMMVVPEGGSLVYNNITMIQDGHTTVEHSLPVPRVYKDLATLFGESGTGYTPTLVVAYGGLSGEYYWYERTNVWENERLLAFTPRDVVDPRSRRRLMAAGEGDFNHIRVAEGAKAIRDAGGLVALGAHGQMQGLGAHWELWSLQQGGMSEVEALRAATLDGAKVLGMGSQLGSIEVGKLADLIVLDGNPLEDIRNTETVNMVMLNGRLYDGMTLDQIGNHPEKRAPFWWERRPTEAPSTATPGAGGRR
jgi:imidazolonepropionase-like amidohydrolase/Tol biopolymer transport system component